MGEEAALALNVRPSRSSEMLSGLSEEGAVPEETAPHPLERADSSLFPNPDRDAMEELQTTVDALVQGLRCRTKRVMKLGNHNSLCWADFVGRALS